MSVPVSRLCVPKIFVVINKLKSCLTRKIVVLNFNNNNNNNNNNNHIYFEKVAHLATANLP